MTRDVPAFFCFKILILWVNMGPTIPYIGNIMVLVAFQNIKLRFTETMKIIKRKTIPTRGKHCKTAKGRPKYISSVCEGSSCSYQHMNGSKKS